MDGLSDLFIVSVVVLVVFAGVVAVVGGDG